MWRYVKNITFVVFVLAVLAFVLMFFIRKYSAKQQDEKETKATSLVNGTVRVYKNYYGIPHIVAQSESDAFFAVGYCQAQDRLWQMDYLRRMAGGRLAEIFGMAAVPIDKFSRALEIRKTAETIYLSIDPKTKELLERYSAGVNYYIKEHRSDLSFEFGALRDTVEDWHPVDCIAVTRLMALEQSLSFWGDLAFGEIAAICGEGKAMELVPGVPDDGPFVTDTLTDLPGVKEKSCFRRLMTYNPVKKNKELYRLLSDFSAATRQVRTTWGLHGTMAGSNSWAIVKPYKDSTRIEAILANDPHLRLSLPAKWYQIHVTCPQFNVTGLSLPGVPFILIGRNDYISWGITSVMLDDCDFFITGLDSNNKDLYIDENGRMKKFSFVRDTILVRGREQIEYYIRRTERSNVISDYHLMRNPSVLLGYDNDSSSYLSKYCLTYSWLGNFYSNECSSAYGLMKAKTWTEFKEAVAFWGVPALNFTYADIHGNIGIKPSGMIALRNRNNPCLPTPANNPEVFWKGVSRYNNFPELFNPAKRYVISANNCTARELPVYLTSYWEPEARAERIDELLKEYLSFRTGYSARDAQIMQYDMISPYARKYLSYVLPVIERNLKNLSPVEKAAFSELKQWDCLLSKESPAAAIYNMMFERLVFNTFYDNLGEYVYREYTFLSSIPTRKIMELMDENNIYWFDDIGTSRTETRDYMLFRSFKDAVRALIVLYDTKDMARWEYGRMHTLLLKHPLSDNPLLDKSLSIGPLETGGNNTTINCTAYNIFAPFDVTVGASARFIADMASGYVYTIVPGGSSGIVTDMNYGDQVQLWLNGGYIALPTGPEPDPSFSLSIEIDRD